MTFTYNLANVTNIERVRMLINDTDEADPLLQDEEINAIALASFPNNVYRAAAQAALMIAAKFGRQLQRSAMGMSDDPHGRADFYRNLADDLIHKAGAASTYQVFAGGRTIDGKISMRDDANATQPSFGVGQDDNPEYRQNGVTGRYFPDEM